MNLDILYDSGGVLAVAKPAGLPTQAPTGIDSVESLLRERLFGPAARAAVAAGRRRHPGGFLGVPHRLDRPVSGVLLLATTPRAARLLSRQFERRQITKTYLAIVAAAAESPAIGETFTWHDTIRKLPDEPKAEIVAAVAAGGRDREAVTTGRVAWAGSGRLLLELLPLTGRMHQLRLQAAARGMPVLGESLYTAPQVSDAPHAASGPQAAALPLAQSDPRAAPIALHAWRIAFADPATAKAIELVCPLPADSPWPWPAI
jgi:23S rRNA pseudouridine1911/1915/1917 synthase